MTNIFYTDSLTALYSEAVDEAYYNANSNDLYVDLNDNMYRYHNVPAETWEKFKNQNNPQGSVGSFYATVIKRQYGPATYLGHIDDLEYEEVEVLQKPTSDPNVTPLGFYSTGPNTVTIAESAKDAVAISTSGNAKVVSLRPFAPTETPEPHKYKHEIVFTNGGAERTWTTEASSVFDAIDALSEISAMLGVDVNVKRVTVHFE